MTHAFTTINPFYAARLTAKAAAPQPEPKWQRPVYAKLPLAPVNASPVPELTSLYHNTEAGPYGDRSYPGNCGGHLIRDLLRYFRPRTVFDPMSGSGTCRDVCVELVIPCESADIHRGFDACAPCGDDRQYDFIWAHPPYWRQKLYADDPRDLSRAPTLDDFLRRYGQFVRNCAMQLEPGGKLAVLMGDYCDREEGMVPLVFYTKLHAFRAGLKQHCTDIIRFSHGAKQQQEGVPQQLHPRPARRLHDI